MDSRHIVSWHGRVIISVLEAVIEREHLAWCEALVNKDFSGILQTTARIDTCLEVGERLDLEVAEPIGWCHL